MYGIALSEKCCTADPRQVTQRLVSAELRSKLRGQDLNLRPRGYEPRELPGCSTPRHETLENSSPSDDWILANLVVWSRGLPQKLPQRIRPAKPLNYGFMRSVETKNPSTSAAASINFVVGVPAPCPARVSMRIR